MGYQLTSDDSISSWWEKCREPVICMNSTSSSVITLHSRKNTSSAFTVALEYNECTPRRTMDMSQQSTVAGFRKEFSTLYCYQRYCSHPIKPLGEYKAPGPLSDTPLTSIATTPTQVGWRRGEKGFKGRFLFRQEWRRWRAQEATRGSRET